MLVFLSIALAVGPAEPERVRDVSGVRNEYSWLPIPRLWVLGGVTNAGGAHGLGASVGLGTSAVVFGEWGLRGPVTDGFYGVGTHTFVGDSYNHVSHGMSCRVIHRHYVRPGLLVGLVRREGESGWRARPEVSFGAFGNLVAAVPVTRMNDGRWEVGGQLGVAVGLP
ncbi:MAG: hypothetical protein H6737_22830 [Alphaproteobacteria bacterium]|nr:hypothetical protein [Alphaproteobacteria bacterium]